MDIDSFNPIAYNNALGAAPLTSSSIIEAQLHGSQRPRRNDKKSYYNLLNQYDYLEQEEPSSEN